MSTHDRAQVAFHPTPSLTLEFLGVPGWPMGDVLGESNQTSPPLPLSSSAECRFASRPSAAQNHDAHLPLGSETLRNLRICQAGCLKAGGSMGIGMQPTEGPAGLRPRRDPTPQRAAKLPPAEGILVDKVDDSHACCLQNTKQLPCT